MLHEAQRTSAPRLVSVSISTAVWIVMWSEPAMRAPRRGCNGPNSSRVAIRPGISVSAMAISLRPQEAGPRCLTTLSGARLAALAEAALMVGAPVEAGAIAGSRAGGNKDIKISLYAPWPTSLALAKAAGDEHLERGHDVGRLHPRGGHRDRGAGSGGEH